MRFVVADDSTIMQQRLQAYIANMGHTTSAVASNGRDAVQACARTRPDIAILDIVMPPMNGDLAAREILAQQTAKFVCIISSNSQDTLRKPILELGVFWLTKPLSEGQFRARIEEITRGYNG